MNQGGGNLLPIFPWFLLSSLYLFFLHGSYHYLVSSWSKSPQGYSTFWAVIQSKPCENWSCTYNFLSRYELRIVLTNLTPGAQAHCSVSARSTLVVGRSEEPQPQRSFHYLRKDFKIQPQHPQIQLMLNTHNFCLARTVFVFKIRGNTICEMVLKKPAMWSYN